MGRRRGRAVHGILVLDKPPGMTSNQALQHVRRRFEAQKAGHTGSLDPMATGVLPICLGEATKVSGYLLDADKTYRFRCRLGERTDTGDADGEVIERCTVPRIDAAAIERALAPLRGEIVQVPPMHSALKHQGQPLYRYARRGESVERPARPTLIHRLECVEHDGDELVLEVDCAKGTYVRTLAEDLGAALGCGAHVTALRRLAAGPFGSADLVTAEQVEQAAGRGFEALDALLLPVDRALRAWPRLVLGAELAGFLRQGQAVQVPGAPASGLLRLHDAEGRLIGLGRVQEDGLVAPKRLMNL